MKNFSPASKVSHSQLTRRVTPQKPQGIPTPQKFRGTNYYSHRWAHKFDPIGILLPLTRLIFAGGWKIFISLSKSHFTFHVKRNKGVFHLRSRPKTYCFHPLKSVWCNEWRKKTLEFFCAPLTHNLSRRHSRHAFSQKP